MIIKAKGDRWSAIPRPVQARRDYTAAELERMFTGQDDGALFGQLVADQEEGPAYARPDLGTGRMKLTARWWKLYEACTAHWDRLDEANATRWRRLRAAQARIAQAQTGAGSAGPAAIYASAGGVADDGPPRCDRGIW